MTYYRNKFNNIHSTTFTTASFQFVVSLLVFFLLCVAYAVIKLPTSTSDTQIFISDFQHYLILAAAISFLFPALFALILIIGLIKIHDLIITICFISGLIYFPFIILGLIGSGIYLAIEGALEVGISAIVLGLLVTVGAIHSLLITFEYIYKQKQKNSE